jgi:hypothetical protein
MGNPVRVRFPLPTPSYFPEHMLIVVLCNMPHVYRNPLKLKARAGNIHYLIESSTCCTTYSSIIKILIWPKAVTGTSSWGLASESRRLVESRCKALSNITPEPVAEKRSKLTRFAHVTGRKSEPPVSREVCGTCEMQRLPPLNFEAFHGLRLKWVVPRHESSLSGRFFIWT